MTGDNSTRRQWWGAVADWRNWRLPVKLGAVLAVPVLVAVGAGMMQIRDYVLAADSYTAMQRMVTLRTGLDPLIAGVQAERALAARRAENAPVDEKRFKDLVRITDGAAAGVRNLADRTASSLGQVATTRYNDAATQLDGLPQLRDRVLDGTVDLTGAIGGYTVVLRALLDFDQAMVGDFGDPALAGTATALHNLAMAGEQMSWQHAMLLAGVSRGSLLVDEQTALEQSWTRQQDKLADYIAVATPQQQAEYRTVVAGQDVDIRNSLVQQVRSDADTVRVALDVKAWQDSSAGTAKRVESVLRSLEDQLKQAAGKLQDETSDRAGLASAILAASLFLACAVGFVVGRYLLRSLRALRVAALDVAQHRLPTLVAQLREDAEPDVTIDPVPVHTLEEFGQLARAFDAVHRQAVDSATEQAELRTSMRNAFINLSRRSQGLVERQLRLMEELERQEQHPERLAGLFKLDNLATRMRRNNENLMVLSGSDLARRFTRPVPLGDVLRAAASEIEQYQRVVVETAPSVEVVGYAAGDLVRLVAELMDNATAFSPPTTQVVVGGRGRPGGGVLVDVVDVGVGMSEEDLAEANAKIARAADDESGELPVSRQLGLYVVGRLAGRHGIQVALREETEGVRAVAALPAELVRAAPPRNDSAGAPSIPAARANRPAGAGRHSAPVEGTAPGKASAAFLGGAGQAGKPSTAAGTAGAGWSTFRGRTADPAPSGPTAFGASVSRGSSFFTKPAPASASGANPAPPTPADAYRPGSTWFRKTQVPAGPPEPARRNGVEHSGHAAGPEPHGPEPLGQPAVPGQGEAPVRENDAGLPKRRPRANLAVERTETPDAVAPVRRDPSATRGFLASYQTGVRQGVKDSGENRTGRENDT